MRRGARAASIPAFIAPFATASRHTKSSPLVTTIVFQRIYSGFKGVCVSKAKGPKCFDHVLGFKRGVCVLITLPPKMLKNIRDELITDLITDLFDHFWRKRV